MKFEPMTFNITDIRAGARTVHGFAVDCESPIRLTVHHDFGCGYICSHYASGLRVTNKNELHASMEGAVASAIQRLDKHPGAVAFVRKEYGDEA